MHAIEIKAQVLAAFLTGEPVRIVMADLRIPRSTAWRWWGEARHWLHKLGRLHEISEAMPRWPRGLRVWICGAKTRAGEPCQNEPMANGRCPARSLSEPGRKLAEDARVDIDGARRFGRERGRIGSEQIWGRLG
jgi:hypothetical protein